MIFLDLSEERAHFNTILGVLGEVFFHVFFCNVLQNILYANSEYADQTPHNVASDLFAFVT